MSKRKSKPAVWPWVVLGVGAAGVYLFARAVGQGVGQAVGEGVRGRVEETTGGG